MKDGEFLGFPLHLTTSPILYGKALLTCLCNYSMHMTCKTLKFLFLSLRMAELTVNVGPCGYEFCWECTGPWANSSCANCFGGPVVQYE